MGCLAVVLAAMAGCSEVGQEAPGTVRDTQPLSIPPAAPESDPWYFQWAGDKVFFVATEAVHGRELWVSDGTSTGTQLVLDINPGGGSSSPNQLVLGDGGLYFRANDGLGERLWVSDGTPGGTRPLLTGSEAESLEVMAFAPAGGSLFLAVPHPYPGAGLWKSDGTPAGTVLLKSLNVAELLKEVDGTLFFLAEDWETGPALWKSDGTPEGTVPLTALSMSGPQVRDSERVGGTLFFTLQSWGDSSTRELWKSDGTPGGTVLLKVFSNVPSIPGYSLSPFEDLTAVGGTLFFVGYDETHGPHLWKSDGTGVGTVRVMPSGLPANWWFEPKFLLGVNGLVYFTAQTMESGNDPWTFSYELWRSDGTAEGTVRLTNFPGEGFDSPECVPVGWVGSRALFSTFKYSEPRSRELWASDGTVEGTVKLRAFAPDFTGAFFWMSGSSQNAFFFAGDDGVHGREPWKTDGTPEGTVMLRDIWADGP
ncbi:hypothetical protein BO221_38745 [Archangium sp. Cb G35]|nr:hypothetical protein BO221_38745 [Archangium sp. Cb G35]